MSEPLLVEYKEENLELEIRVNDWLIASERGGIQGMFSYLTNIQIDGENRIRISASPPAGQSEGAVEAELTVSVHGATSRVYSLAWNAANPTPPLPLKIDAAFSSPTRYGVWSWQRAQPVTLDAATISGVTGLVQALHRGLGGRKDDDGAAPTPPPAP